MRIKNQTQLINTAVKLAISVAAPLLTVNTIFAESSEQEIWQAAYKQFHQGNSQACFQSLMKLDHLIGDISYDRLLGLCAQGAGNNSQALLAYNRIMAQQEQNAEIRLERARVLYNLSLLSESRSEFKNLLALNPPTAARQMINNYLFAIERRTSKVQSYSRLKISTAIGQDDNVNSASNLDEFLGFTLNDNSKASSSNYTGLSLLAEHQFKFSSTSGLKLSTSLNTKRYPDAAFVDQDLITLSSGYTKFFDSSALNVDLLAYRQSVDGNFNSRGFLFKTAISRSVSPTTTNSTYITAGAIRYADILAVKAVNPYSLGTAFTYTPRSLPKDNFSLDLSVGHDYPLFADSNYEADFSSLKLSHKHKFNKKLKSLVMLEYKNYRYDNPFFALSFPEDRSDDTIAARISLDWDVNDRFKLTPSYAYRDNNSNVDLFSYNRWYAEINASYQWVW